MVPARGIGQARSGNIGQLVGNPGDPGMLEPFLADTVKGDGVKGLGALGAEMKGNQGDERLQGKDGKGQPGDRNFSHNSLV
jgi:hypothetical protein